MQPVFGRLGEDFEQLSNTIRTHGEDSLDAGVMTTSPNDRLKWTTWRLNY